MAAPSAYSNDARSTAGCATACVGNPFAPGNEAGNDDRVRLMLIGMNVYK